MTTIAVRDNVIAADTLLTQGDAVVGYVDKTSKIGNWLVGAAGPIIEYSPAISYLTPLLLQDIDLTSAVYTHIDKSHGSRYAVLMSHGAYGIWEYDGILTKVSQDFYAIGSGAEYAMGAMAYGADAETAVKAAMKFNTKTGGTVTVLR